MPNNTGSHPIRPESLAALLLEAQILQYQQYQPFPHKCRANINPFQSNFSANHILPSSYLMWAGKRLVDYLLSKVRTT